MEQWTLPSSVLWKAFETSSTRDRCPWGIRGEDFNEDDRLFLVDKGSVCQKFHDVRGSMMANMQGPSMPVVKPEG